MLYHAVLMCSVLLNLSMTTKLEMQKLLPKAASYCIENPEGRLSVAYGPIQRHNDSGFRQWGNNERETRHTPSQVKGSTFATGHSP